MIVALETATDLGSVALLEGEHLLAERALPDARQHTARILVELDALLAECGRTLAQVELIALSIGPGTFTGLRVGLATALGLAFGTPVRLAPVSTLAALALRAPGALALPLLDARRGQVYAGLYGARAEPRLADRVCDPAEVAGLLAGLEGPVTVLGPGADRHRAELEPALGPAGRWEASGQIPRARDVGVLGARLAASGGALDPADVEPRYLRASDARPPAALQRPGDRIP